jgi:hypothetical protein
MVWFQVSLRANRVVAMNKARNFDVQTLPGQSWKSEKCGSLGIQVVSDEMLWSSDSPNITERTSPPEFPKTQKCLSLLEIFQFCPAKQLG